MTMSLDAISDEELGRFLRQQYAAIELRKQAPADSLTSRLLQDDNLLVKKLGEEFAEFVAALAKKDAKNLMEELQQLAGWLPMVAAVSLGVKEEDYFRSLANLGGDYYGNRR